MRNNTESPSTRRRAWRTDGSPAAFTLLELLLVLALMATLLVGLSSIISLFSRHYASNERRVGRAQLARSISQMLSDDLGAAVQDPIVAVDSDPARQYVRHFGLRGDSRSLQIDVVQPSSFTPVADAAENRRVMSGGDKSPEARQVPELKTIFYEFVPINETQSLPGDAQEDDATSTVSGLDDGFDFGSTLGGSLAGDPNAAAMGLASNELDQSTLFWDGVRPLVQKFGLSRRELDYETPEEDDAGATNETDAYLNGTTGAGSDVSRLSGSLNSVPTSSSTLTGALGTAANLTGLGVSAEDVPEFLPPLSAAQIAMDSDDGTTWAPEVLDCRFRYFDGSEWFDSWDSLERNGLPVAIKVELKLAPLDDVDAYRASPMMFMLPKAPSVEELEKLAQQANRETGDDGVNSSRLAGSLTGNAGTTTTDGDPVDVFNSYRTPSSTLLALRGVPRVSATASAYSQTVQSSALSGDAAAGSDSLNDGLDAGADALFSGGLGGGLTGGDASGLATGAGTDEAVGGSLGGGGYSNQNSTGDAFLDEAQQLASGGAVFNSAGICVDFMNDGTYVTLEGIAQEIGVSEPSYYEVIAYLPTTPFSRAKVIERRQPSQARQGAVARNGGRGAGGAAGRRTPGANPYATGTSRAPRERQVNERGLNERTGRERQFGERAAGERATAQRNAAPERGGRERQANQRGGPLERGGNERQAANRTVRERNGGGGGAQTGLPADPLASASVPDLGGMNPAQTSPVETAPQTGLAGAAGGGLAGNGGATSLGGLDPFAIVNQTNADVPFSSGAFSDVDASLSGGVAQGLIADPNGANVVQTPNPSTPAAPAQRQQTQTWIRGGKR